MKQHEFRTFCEACRQAKNDDAIWSCGFAFLNLSERQVEKLRVVMKSSLYSLYNAVNGDVILPNGIILKKMTKDYAIYVNGYYHHTIEAWNNTEAIEYAKKKSKLYGLNYNVTLYDDDGNKIGGFYQGFSHIYEHFNNKKGGAQ